METNIKETSIIFLEKQYKALASRRRLAILKHLKNCHNASVGQIAEKIKLGFKATSKHLRILSQLDLLVKEQQSLICIYSISKDLPEPVLNALKIL